MPDGDLLTAEQFAAKVKAKYPDYAHLPDQELTSRILAKYPEYSESVMAPGVAEARKVSTTLPPPAFDAISEAMKPVPRPPGGGEEAMLAEGAPPAAGALAAIGTAGELKTNPMAAIRGLGGAALGGYAAEKGAEKLGGGPVTRTVAGTAGSLLGGGIGAGMSGDMWTEVLTSGKPLTKSFLTAIARRLPGIKGAVEKYEADVAASEAAAKAAKTEAEETAHYRRLVKAGEKLFKEYQKEQEILRAPIDVKTSPGPYRGPESVPSKVSKVSEGPGPYTGPSSVPKPAKSAPPPQVPFPGASSSGVPSMTSASGQTRLTPKIAPTKPPAFDPFEGMSSSGRPSMVSPAGQTELIKSSAPPPEVPGVNAAKQPSVAPGKSRMGSAGDLATWSEEDLWAQYMKSRGTPLGEALAKEIQRRGLAKASAGTVRPG